MNSTSRLDHLGGPAAVAAGILWLLVWLHQRATHGATQENEERILFGLTWLDSGKFLILPLILLFVGIVSLYMRRGRPGWLGRIGFAVTVAGLVGMIVGTALQFWFFPWGSYAVGFENPGPHHIGGPIQPISTLVFTLGLIVLSIDLVRAKVVPWWAAPVLVLGGFATFYLTPVNWLPVLAWLLLGLLLWSGRSKEGGRRTQPAHGPTGRNGAPSDQEGGGNASFI